MSRRSLKAQPLANASLIGVRRARWPAPRGRPTPATTARGVVPQPIGACAARNPSARPFAPRLAACLGGLWIALIAGCAPPQRLALERDGVRLHIDAASGALRLESGGRSLFEADLRSFGVAEGNPYHEMQFGMFRIDESSVTPLRRADEMIVLEVPEERDESATTRFVLRGDGQPLANGSVGQAAPGHWVITLAAEATSVTKSALALRCGAREHFAGFGAHTHDVDFRGQVVPVWVSEQGVGKREDNEVDGTLWYLSGRRHTTHVAVPATVTSTGRALALESHAFSRFDVCASDPDRLQVEVFDATLTLHIFAGPTPIDAIERLTAFTGRPSLPPPWVFAPWNDAIFGTEEVRAFARFLREAEIPSSAIWSEDFRGGEWRGDVYRIHEDWGFDEALYPEYEDLVGELRALGFMHQLYFNPFLTSGRDVFDEATRSGFAIAHALGGEPFLFDGADIDFSPTAMLDLTHPGARAFLQGHLRSALARGARGWMADFAEWMPVESVRLASGEAPARVHNAYPVLWARAHDEAVRQAGLAHEAIVFYRSAALFSQPHVPVLWAGDQRTDFQRDDGMPTVIPMGLGAGAVGFPYFAHDIGGYQSATNPPTSRELFFRWTELGAFTPVMRTHHGTHARRNWNLRSDEASTAHFRRYAEVHIRLYPYLRALALRAAREGTPLWLAPGLLYPDNDELWPLLDQFFLGDALLVAPVVEDQARAREVTLPAGRFVRLRPWLPGADALGEVLQGPRVHEVAAPLDDIPVFLRAGGILPLSATPAMTLLPGGPTLPGLESTEGDRELFVALGAEGDLTEESGAAYELRGEGTSLAGLPLDAAGAVVVVGNDEVVGDDFRFRLRGHPDTRQTRIYFR